jgi:hypothetical protein
MFTESPQGLEIEHHVRKDPEIICRDMLAVIRRLGRKIETIFLAPRHSDL